MLTDTIFSGGRGDLVHRLIFKGAVCFRR